ncbi:MAG: PSD1 and planctomycete cytochrome C domain-containing protein, partial [Gemmataceae bacterium]|nr:PSD1 and planctomycete cytochrome C domain-containing protein [Gemmataceae bacterium]
LPAADFARDVKPVLEKHCVSCHGPEKQRGGLRLDAARFLREGGNSGPGNPVGSQLLLALAGKDGYNPMPPKGPRVTPEETRLLREWIEAGARPPREEIAVPRRKSGHWAFQPVRSVPPPEVKGASWARNGLDRFILARLEKEGIKPSPEAPSATLLRRVAFDLTGLPPSPGLLSEPYERAVERLLASPAYGERWARHWLDGARYADSNLYSIDSARAAWRWRDWVIQALNDGMPFDRFTIEQLAGDLLPGATQSQKVATGFHRNTMVNEEGGIDKEQFRVEAIVDRTNTTGAVWLGLTVGCCQCHDHKFDPLSQKEYYRLYSFFNHSDDPKLELIPADSQKLREANLKAMQALEKRLVGLDGLTDSTLERWEGSLSAETRKALPASIQTILAIAVNGRTPKQHEALWTFYRKAEKAKQAAASLAGPFAALASARLLKEREKLEQGIARLKKGTPASMTALVLNERKMRRPDFVQIAGDFLRKGAAVAPGTPDVLPPLPEGAKPDRLALARWLVDGKHPLTGRVLVNRLWQQHFGLGLVETDNDFGTQGTKPTHPELLDWLAGEVVRRGWSLKEMHRLIVTSATYRQSSRARPDLATLDPRNRLLARQSRLRLEAEAVRDATLAYSGLLTARLGGPSVFPPQPEGVYGLTQVPKNWQESTGPDRYRRGLYTWFWRSAPHPNLTVFDAPDATAACTRRNRSNTPLQALTLLNDAGFVECAEALGERARKREGDDGSRLSFAFGLVAGRPPSAREKAILSGFLARQKALLGERAWSQLGRVLINLDEAITRE